MKTLKYIIHTGKTKIYSLYIMEAEEYYKGKYIALFLYYDESNEIKNPETLWTHLRHRLLFENSIEAIKQKVIEYGEGRGEEYTFEETN